MNAVILTAVLSAGNSGLYVSTRMLYAMAETGQAPKCFLKLNKRGVPSYALFATVVFGLAAFLTSFIGEGKAYSWLVNISGMAGFITWIGIAICHYRFRRAYIAQGKDLKDLPYRATLFPFGPILALIMCIIVTAGQNYSAFTGAEIDWYGASVAYIGIPVFFLVFFWHRLKHHNHLIPLKDVNLSRDTNMSK
jgi:lysine-specific permease